jgi:hypothetical protein
MLACPLSTSIAVFLSAFHVILSEAKDLLLTFPENWHRDPLCEIFCPAGTAVPIRLAARAALE